MNIWLISIFEQTPVDKVFSTRFINIADEATARGHNVTFFASTYKHNTKNQRYDDTTIVRLNDNYRLVFVKSISYTKNIAPRRMYAHYDYSKRLVREFVAHEKPDVIFIAFPPISIAYEVSKWASKQGIPVILDIIDPWPDIFRTALRKIPSALQDLILFPMTVKLKATLRKVRAVSAISNQYLKWATSYYPGIPETLCAYPAVKLKDMRTKLKEISITHLRDETKLRVIYAGSLASSYDIPAILEAAKILNQKYADQIEFVIAGVGPQADLIQQYQVNLSNLYPLGRLPKETLMKEYFLADLGLIQHKKGATQSVTYKLFDLLACSLPIMNSLESEMNSIILDNEVGMFNPPGDSQKLAANIEFLFLNRTVLNKYKENALQLTMRLGDADVVYKKIVNLMESVTVPCKV